MSYFLMAACYWNVGDYKNADLRARQALALIKGDKQSYRYEITYIYSLVGMKDEAVRQIKKGNKRGFQLIKDYLYPYPYLMTNPFFAGLRDYPGFQEIIRNEEAKFRAKLKKYGDL